MTENEMKLDMMVAELDYENRLLRARNERLEQEMIEVRNKAIEDISNALAAMHVFGDTAASFAAFVKNMKI